MKFSGPPFAQYGIQTSPKLPPIWTEIATIIADASGKASYTNSISSDVSMQFHRGVVK
jgi:hypothetical protein